MYCMDDPREWDNFPETDDFGVEDENNSDDIEGTDDYDDSMDGDHDSAMRDIGWGTDEDYGGTDERL